MLKNLLCTLLVLLPLAASGEEARLTCTADTNISSYSTETEFNYGQSSRLRLKGIQMLALFQFDLAPVRNWKVQSATLHLRYAGSERKLRTLGFSTIAAPWTEGSGSGQKRAGEVSFAWQQTGKSTWAGPLTDFTDVSYSLGHTLSSYADIREEGDGWFSVDVAPEIVQAMIAGISYGIAVSDEKGQTAANNDVFSREQSNSQPYLVVRGGPSSGRVNWAAVGQINVANDSERAGFDTSAVKVSFASPSNAFGYLVQYSVDGAERMAPRYQIPLAGRGGTQSFSLAGLPASGRLDWVEVTTVSQTGLAGTTSRSGSAMLAAKPRPAPLSAPASTAHNPQPGDRASIPGVVGFWASPDGTKVHPVNGNVLEEVGAERYGGSMAGTYRQSNAVWDGRAIHLSGARNEIVAANLVVETVSGNSARVTITMDESLRSPAGEIRIRPSLFREWYVRDRDWMPEIAVPLAGPFSVPAVDNAVPGQRNQAIEIEFLVPKAAAPGIYSGRIQVESAGKTLAVPVTLRVNALTLPDTLSFDVSLNAYGTFGHLFGIDDSTAEYRALEREYHCMAHIHRTTLVMLGYSHSGRISTNYAPPLAGEGRSMHVVDWSAWDSQFGPYLDGTAFADLPRAGVPVTHLYLPFHEAWPSDIRKHYHYTPAVLDYPATITEHALKAAPIEQVMDETLAQEFVSVMREANQHFRDKGWTRTDFQFYLNDKNYYKDPKQGGQGTSWWLLDEPNYRDDWLALAYFGRLYRQATGGKGPIRFREDISRPEWQRDYVHGMVDLMVVGGAFFRKERMLRALQREEGVRYWNYGTANGVRDSNLEADGWAIKAWLHGADAIVPWNSIGSDKNFAKPDATALLLPGKRFGVTGPVASLRLKALRRAQQDVEYLVLLAKGKGWDRDQVAEALRNVLPLKGDFRQAGPEDAGSFEISSLTAESLASMRRAVSAALSKGGE